MPVGKGCIFYGTMGTLESPVLSDIPPRSSLPVVALTLVLLALLGCRQGKHPLPASGIPSLQSSAIQSSGNDTIRLAFYNVENLFDLVDNGTEYPEYRPGSDGWNKQMYAIKNGHIAAVIVAMHPDIIGLSEVENRNTLLGLQQEIRRQGVDLPYSAIADGPNHSVNCPALLSRFPITGSHGVRPESPIPTRNFLVADLDCRGAALRVYVNHWPAKFHPESQRLAVAQTLAETIRGSGRATPYVIIGDLNSDYDEWRTFRTRGFDDTKGITGLNHVLGTIVADSGGTADFAAKTFVGRSGGFYHFDCWLDVPPEKRMSMCYRGLHETPDHMLLPRALLCGSVFTYCDSSFSPFTGDGRILKNGEPFGWQMRGFGTRRVHIGEGFSDHLPVILRLIERRGAPANPLPDSATAAPLAAPPKPTGPGDSGEVWLPASGGFSVTREAAAAPGAAGLCVKGDAPLKNCAAAYTLIRRPTLNQGRWSRITFDIRGNGKIQLRLKKGHGKWRFYSGPAFRYYRSSRYLSSDFPAWRHMAISFLADNTASPDLVVELCAGKGEPFCVHLRNFTVE
jgi:endonuclease/exonuclease/phosphatase family metal-dependent hydrolase